jgi:flagellar basal-body rod protein FlgF
MEEAELSSALYVSLSAQSAMERRMTTIADNVANINTPGFRATGVKFDEVMQRVGTEDVSFASNGEEFVSRKSGPVNHTGNPLDIAVDKQGWIGISTPDGPAYTRDGRLRMDERGALQTVGGFPVLDPGGSPISVDPTAGPITIAEDGMITQDGRQVGAIGVFELPEASVLTRAENSAVYSSMPAVPVEDPVAGGVRQGYLEGSNVDPMMEMVRLIEVSRAFESAAAAVQKTEDAQQETARALGPTG